MAEKYDDLDDLLDEFEGQDEVLNQPPGAVASSAGTAAPAPQDTKVASAREPDASAGDKKSPRTRATESDGPPLDEDFARKLNLGMDELVKEMGGDPQAQQAFEALIANLTGTAPTEQAGARSGPGTTPESFQDAIAQTMDRLNESKEGMADAASDDFLEKMLKELQGAAGAGGAGTGDMNGLLAGLMEELSSKDILYEPIKEMHDKYPEWLDAHKAELSAEELARYRDQQRVIDDMIAKFEDPRYSDDDPVCRKYIAAKMEAMQASGAPPPELVGALADGAIPGGDFSGNADGCVVQ